MAAEDEKYIEAEKAKYQNEDTTQHDLNAEMLKKAQTIDRDSRMNKMWADNEDEEGDEDETFGVDEDSNKDSRKKKSKQDNASKRPNKQKFAEIMKNQEAFPTLENEFMDEEDEELSETEAVVVETKPQE